MLRKIITIDQEKCNGCGLCVQACHEQAIGIADGKAVLLRDDYCDGLGDCLPVCPADAISFEVREAAAYDEAAVLANKTGQKTVGCPGTQAQQLQPPHSAPAEIFQTSQLQQWPVQIKLVNPHAAYLQNSRLLIAADCTAFAYGDFHRKFIKNHITLIGCPKLDNEDYSRKLTEILLANDVKSVTVVRMEVPCCGGIEQAVKTALQQSGRLIPWQVVTISTDGQILEEIS
ncbi:ATP-binding protein [Phascolarctobacterium sp.]